MIDVLLGIIAVATLTTAVVELVVVFGLVRIVFRLKQRADRLSRLVAPLAGHAAEISGNMNRALSLAQGQFDRVVAVYSAVEVPLGRIATAMAVARSVAAVVRHRPRRRSRRQSK